MTRVARAPRSDRVLVVVVTVVVAAAVATDGPLVIRLSCRLVVVVLFIFVVFVAVSSIGSLPILPRCQSSGLAMHRHVSPAHPAVDANAAAVAA